MATECSTLAKLQPRRTSAMVRLGLGGGITWVDVTGTNVQAVSNTGYLADNAAQVVIALPVSPSVGDVVQVSGAGAGGWKIAQNASQSIITKGLPGGSEVTWTARASSQAWFGVASSSDGNKLVAVVNGGQIYTSTDSGVTWTARASSQNWQGVASSSDGSKLVAAIYGGGQIYTSTDSGVTWTAGASSQSWTSVASSSDGSKLVATVNNGGQIYTADVGQTTLGTSGMLSGSQFDAIELQYLGNGLFLPLSYESYSGSFTIQ